jgi:hypothetical protein
MTIKTEIAMAPPVADPMDKQSAELATDSTSQFDIVQLEDPAEEVASGNEEWPVVFYCKRTHALMTDPMVGPDGNSIESSAIDDDQEERSTFYSNRALQAIMQETIFLRGDSIRSSLKHFQQSVSQSLSNMLPESTANEPLFRALNDALYCPITFNLMHEPVIDPEGNTFEKVAVENWIRVNQNSPITRADLQIDQLYPNTAIKFLLDQEKEKPEDQMHPSIRKWKEEPAPMATDIELGGGHLLEQQQQQQNQDTTNFMVITTTNGGGRVNYPTTPSEWSQREAFRRRSMYHFFGMVFAGVCLIGFVMYGSIYFVLLFVLVMLIIFSKRRASATSPNQQS